MRPQQKSLFPLEEGPIRELIDNNQVHVRESTFLAKLSSRVHRWFRLTPSFGDDLVRKMLRDMDTSEDHVVLDPFSGAGTTLVEAKLEGLACVGFEINPLLHFVCSTLLRWDLSSRKLRNAYGRIEEVYGAKRRALQRKGVEDIGIPLPAIHNVYRWWRADVLKDLLILREAIRSESRDDDVRDFFLLGLAAVLVPDLTNVTLGRLQLHFIDRSDDKIDVWKTFAAHAENMLDDFTEIPAERAGIPSQVHHIDSTSEAIESLGHRIDRVITSPPYPNRYSYVWNTRPHLYMLEIIEKAKEASDIDKKTIGGTWGTATSELAKGVIEPRFPVIEKEVKPVADEIRKVDNLMANYLMHYFNRLALQIVRMGPLLSGDAQCAYVVGCSWLKKVYVETDVLLAHVFEGLDLGFKTKRIERIRRRHSGKDLHESIVYVAR